MTNNKKIHVPIERNETVSSVSAGKVASTWNPGEGAARQQEIEQARQQAWQEHQQKLEQQHPMAVRLSLLEAVVGHLQTELQELKANAS